VSAVEARAAAVKWSKSEVSAVEARAVAVKWSKIEASGEMIENLEW
jgi:hypothetical protein